MMLNAYAVFDLKAAAFHPPFFLSTDGLATRFVQDMVNDANSLIGRHPSDFVVYCIGTFNDSNGTLEPIAPRRHVADAAALSLLSRLPQPDASRQPADQRGLATNGFKTPSTDFAS